MSKNSPLDLARTTRLAAFLLQFARVNRITLHPDGKRLETDADHTVMLAVIACDLCPPSLNRGRVAEFAIAHDLVEGVEGVGDTQTLTIDAAGRLAKDAREAEGLNWIRAQFGADSWMVRTIEAYEAQEEEEACFVKVLDKVLPKLTHTLNGCAAAKGVTDWKGFVQSHEAQYMKLYSSFVDHPWGPELMTLLSDAMVASEEAWNAK